MESGHQWKTTLWFSQNGFYSVVMSSLARQTYACVSVMTFKSQSDNAHHLRWSSALQQLIRVSGYPVTVRNQALFKLILSWNMSSWGCSCSLQRFLSSVRNWCAALKCPLVEDISTPHFSRDEKRICKHDIIEIICVIQELMKELYWPPAKWLLNVSA